MFVAVKARRASLALVLHMSRDETAD